MSGAWKSALKRYNMENEKDPKTSTVGFHRWRTLLCEVDLFLYQAVVLPTSLPGVLFSYLFGF